MAEIIVDQTDLNITITPNTTQLNVFTGGYACAQGNTTEFQYNNGGVLAGAYGLTYNSGSQTTTAANLTVTNDTNLGAVGNVTITGGNVNQFLQTDGAGGLSFADVANANYANFAGTVLTNAQPNITSVGTLSNLTVSGNVTANFFIGNGSQLTGIGDGTQISNGTSNVRVNSANGNVTIGVGGNANILVATSTGIVVTRANLGNASNLTITGGINGYFLQTDGTGNLTWAAGGNVSGNGVPGGANTQIQFNDGGSFGGKAGFTFNRTTNLLNAPGAITAVGNVTGSFIIGDGGFLSNVSAGQFLSNGNSNLGLYTSNGNATISIAGVSNVVVVSNSGINVAGYVNATGNVIAGNVYANSGTIRANLLTGTLTTNAQPNITSVGTLSSLAVTGNVSAGNMSVTGIYTGNGSGLSQLTGANVTGTVANATYAISAGSTTTAGTVTTAAQPNITSLGNLTSLNVVGTTIIQQAIEKVTTNATGSTGTVNFDVLDQAILLKTSNASANFTINIRGNSGTALNTVMSSNQSMTLAYINTNGSTAYIANNIQIDGANRTVIYSPGSNTTFNGTANGKDIYTFNIIKTASNTYTIFGTRVGFS
jgi:hypothetical protein